MANTADSYDDDLDDKIEELVEEKVKERLEERMQEELEKRGIEPDKEKDVKKNSDRGISRRSFLKKIGAGALGLGAMSLNPSAAFDVRSSKGLEVFANGSPHFDVNPGGPVEVKNADFGIGTSPSYPLEIVDDQQVLSRIRRSGQGFFQFKVDSSAGSWDNYFHLTSNEWHIGHNSSNRNLALGANDRKDLIINTGGSIEIPNGSLNLTDQINVEGTSQLINLTNSNTNHNWEIYSGGGVGDNGLGIYDRTNSQYLLQMLDSGDVSVPSGSLDVQGNTVWHSGNDGEDSGLNADKIDGQHASDLQGIAASSDASDLSRYTDTGGGTVVDITGSGTVISGFIYINGKFISSTNLSVEVDVDGANVIDVDAVPINDSDDDQETARLSIPPIRFTQSLRIDYDAEYSATAEVWVKQ